MIRTRLQTTHTITPGHYIVARTTTGGWHIEENQGGRITPLVEQPITDRAHADVIAAAYAATRSHTATNGAAR